MDRLDTTRGASGGEDDVLEDKKYVDLRFCATYCIPSVTNLPAVKRIMGLARSREWFTTVVLVLFLQLGLGPPALGKAAHSRIPLGFRSHEPSLNALCQNALLSSRQLGVILSYENRLIAYHRSMDEDIL